MKTSEWLRTALLEHEANVAKGCTCSAPSVSGKMKFKPRSAECPMHGELAVS